jgi:hypothetical protein
MWTPPWLPKCKPNAGAAGALARLWMMWIPPAD